MERVAQMDASAQQALLTGGSGSGATGSAVTRRQERLPAHIAKGPLPRMVHSSTLDQSGDPRIAILFSERRTQYDVS